MRELCVCLEVYVYVYMLVYMRIRMYINVGMFGLDVSLFINVFMNEPMFINVFIYVNMYVYMHGLKYDYMCMSTFTNIGAFLCNVNCICGCCPLVISCFLFSFEISVELDTILSHVKDFVSLFA